MNNPEQNKDNSQGQDHVNISSIVEYIDHTLLKPTATRQEVVALCREAILYNFACVCVNPSRVEVAAAELLHSTVKLCAVVGFPLGANQAATKAFEARAAVTAGATEIDMVINLGAAYDNDMDVLKADVTAVRSAIGAGVILKVIIESAAIQAGHKEAVARVVESAGADYVKTSTGFHAAGGATIEDVQLLRRTLAPSTKIKASGGIRDLSSALKMIEAGADRLGTSSGVAIADAFRASRL